MKKKTVKLVSAVVVLGVVSGAYVGVNSYVSSQEKKESEAEDTSVELTSLDTDNITSVAFTAGQDKVEFDKKDDTWSEKGDADFPVNQDTLNTAVGGVASLSAAQEISDVEDLSEYDLDSPQNEITLTTDDGDTVLQIGMENESTSQYYVRKSDDDKKVYLVDSSAVGPFMGTLYDFAESGTFPSVTSSTITEVKVDKEDGYELTQDPDNLFWNVSDGKTSEKADTDKAGTVTSAIGSLAYDSFVDYNCTDDSKYGFDDPYAVITAKYTEEETVEETVEQADKEETKEKKKTEKSEKAVKKKAKKDKKDEKIEELNDRLMRNLAEFENFRNRSEKEKSAMFEIGAKSVVEKMLPVVDNLERGFDGLSDEEKETPFAKGIEAVYKQLLTGLEEIGVTPIEAVGKEFDPNFHNAVMHDEDDSDASNQVIEEFQKGYMYKDSVVRHSMVKVLN